MTRTTFRLAISATGTVDAPMPAVWSLLADQAGWNSTLSSFEGQMAVGNRVTFEIPDAPGQRFTNTVTACDEPRLLAWRLSRWPLLVGERTYRLSPAPGGGTEVTIAEAFSGLLLPLAARTFPGLCPHVRAHAGRPAGSCGGAAHPAGLARDVRRCSRSARPSLSRRRCRASGAGG